MAKMAKKKPKKVAAKAEPKAAKKRAVAKGSKATKAAPKRAKTVAKKHAAKKKVAAAPKRKAAKKVAKPAPKKKPASKKVAKAARKGVARRPAPKPVARSTPKVAARKAKAAPKRKASPRTNRARATEADFAHKSAGRPDDAAAFLPEPGQRNSRRVKDDLAEELGEDFVTAATSGESTDDAHDAALIEEEGGPFVTTSAESQYAGGIDASNPPGAEREPFPRTQGGPR